MQTVEFDFTLAGQEKRRLNETAEGLKELAHGACEESMQELFSAWDSESSRAFQQKELRWKVKIQRTAEVILAASEALQAAGRKAEHMEKRAEEIAGDC